MVKVVCGIIVREDGHVLIGQRPERKHLSGQWEFPGGKIEINESAEDALRREIYEELGVGINVVYKFQCLHHTYDNGVSISMIPFVCELIKGHENPKSLEHTTIEWVSEEEIIEHKLVAADVEVLALYRTWKLNIKQHQH